MFQAVTKLLKENITLVKFNDFEKLDRSTKVARVLEAGLLGFNSLTTSALIILASPVILVHHYYKTERQKQLGHKK